MVAIWYWKIGHKAVYKPSYHCRGTDHAHPSGAYPPGLLIPISPASEIEVLHWWTAGGEARAADVLRSHWQDLGYRWIDAAIAGGGGKSAMLVLRSRRALSHQLPQAAHLKGLSYTSGRTTAS